MDTELEQETARPGSAAAMINMCFRHQHPEAYGQAEVSEPLVPASLRYGRDQEPLAPSCVYVQEEPMGFSDAEPLRD